MEVGDQGADVARAVLLAALPAALPHIINIPDQSPCYPVRWHVQNTYMQGAIRRACSPHLRSPAGQSK